jgi:hypothetical protein
MPHQKSVNYDINGMGDLKVKFGQEKELARLNLNELTGQKNKLIVVSYLDFFKLNGTDYLIIACNSGDIIIHDIDQNKVLATKNLHTDNFTQIKKVNYLGKDYLISSSFDRNICFTNLENIETVRHSLDIPATCFLFNYSSDIIYIGDLRGNVKLILSQTFEVIMSKQVHKSRLVSIELTENNQNMITYAKDRYFCLLNASNLNIIKAINIDYMIDASINIDNMIFFISDMGEIYKFDKDDGNLLVKKHKPNVIEKGHFQLSAFKVENKAFVVYSYTGRGIGFFCYVGDKLVPVSQLPIINLISFDIVRNYSINSTVNNICLYSKKGINSEYTSINALEIYN